MLCVSVGVVSHYYLKGSGATRRESRERGRINERRGKKEKPIGDCRMDAQVLLLIEPGAELGWAELSDRLPSIGGERKQDNR